MDSAVHPNLVSVKRKRIVFVVIYFCCVEELGLSSFSKVSGSLRFGDMWVLDILICSSQLVHPLWPCQLAGAFDVCEHVWVKFFPMHFTSFGIKHVLTMILCSHLFCLEELGERRP